MTTPTHEGTADTVDKIVLAMRIIAGVLLIVALIRMLRAQEDEGTRPVIIVGMRRNTAPTAPDGEEIIAHDED